MLNDALGGCLAESLRQSHGWEMTAVDRVRMPFEINEADKE